jgi:hypothetical protein
VAVNIANQVVHTGMSVVCSSGEHGHEASEDGPRPSWRCIRILGTT